MGGVREEGEERAGGGSSKKSGKLRGAGGNREKLRNNTQYFANYKS